MTPWDRLEQDLKASVHPAFADRLLDNVLADDNLLGAYAGVADLVSVLSAPATAAELSREAETVEAMRRALRAPRPAGATYSKRALAVVAAAAAMSTSVAWASGLPAALQHGGATVLGRVGEAIGNVRGGGGEPSAAEATETAGDGRAAGGTATTGRSDRDVLRQAIARGRGATIADDEPPAATPPTQQPEPPASTPPEAQLVLVSDVRPAEQPAEQSAPPAAESRPPEPPRRDDGKARPGGRGGEKPTGRGNDKPKGKDEVPAIDPGSTGEVPPTDPAEPGPPVVEPPGKGQGKDEEKDNAKGKAKGDDGPDTEEGAPADGGGQGPGDEPAGEEKPGNGNGGTGNNENGNGNDGNGNGNDGNGNGPAPEQPPLPQPPVEQPPAAPPAPPAPANDDEPEKDKSKDEKDKGGK